MGLGVGLMNEISFKDGKVQQRNLDDYLVLRISDAPRETHVTSCRTATICRWAAWASPACRRSPRR